jgi:RNA polymerase sigma factor (sigma-70 family)
MSPVIITMRQIDAPEGSAGGMSEGRQSPRKDGVRDWNARLALHARWLRTVITTRSGDAGATDEIYQEIALATVRQNPDVPDAMVGPWLYRVAVRQALSHRRRLGRQRKLRERLAVELPSRSDEIADPLIWLLADERQQLIRRAVQQLHAKDAELLLLKYTEDWTYHDLVEHLGISHSAVETRLHRARQRLRDALIALEVTEATS